MPQIAVILNDLRGEAAKFDEGTHHAEFGGIEKFLSLESLFPTCRRSRVSATRNLIKLLRPRNLLGEKKRGNRLPAVRF
jgi:hypothetical protein